MSVNKKGFCASGLKVLPSVLLLSIFPVLVYCSETATKAVEKSLELCVKNVIPSLFPFLVLASLITSSGAAEVIGKIIGKPFEKLFGIDRSCAALFLIGNLSGYPAGAAAAAGLVQNGCCSREDAARSLAFCNNTGPAFLITGIGAGILGNKEFGIMLWITQLCASIICGLFFGRSGGNSIRTERENTVPGTPVSTPKKSYQVFVKSVSQSAVNMLTICAFIVFFGVITEYIGKLLPIININSSVLYSLLVCFTELTSGVRAASAFDTMPALLITSAAVGWSGLSVHFQTAAVLEDSGISMRYYLFGKFLQTALCPFFIFALMTISGYA